MQSQDAWKGLETLLLELVPGDEVRIATLSRDTGLDEATCEMVLQALTRVELFTLKGDVFVRRRIFDPTRVQTTEPPGSGC
jgi:hypothetical protein